MLLMVMAVFFYRWMLKLADYCRGAAEFVATQNKNAVSLRRMAEVEATLTELTDSYDALLESHKKLRARIGMRAVRDKRQVNGDGEIPDATKDPAGYKRAMRLKLQRNGTLKG